MMLEKIINLTLNRTSRIFENIKPNLIESFEENSENLKKISINFKN